MSASNLATVSARAELGATAQALVRRRGVALMSVLLVLVPTLYLSHLWLDPRQPWIHPELLGTSHYIWSNPAEEGFLDRLRKALDWKAFDPNVNRVRPLNDLTETIDAIARPYLTELVGPNPALAPSTIVTAILSPVLLAATLRSWGLSRVGTAALAGVFISSAGFLSVIFSYIHPAKKLTILLLCFALYLASRHARSRSIASFVALAVTLFLSFFADEMDLANYVVIGVIFFASVIGTFSAHWKRLLFLALPPAFLVSVAWALPALYLRYSVHGAWDALSDGKKVSIVRYLVDPNFYQVSLIHTATAFLTTVGIESHTRLTEVAALGLVLAVAGFAAFTLKSKGRLSSTGWGVLGSTFVLVATSTYATLLDWYPFPDQVSYLGAFTYYYHSSLGVLVIIWLAFTWQFACELARPGSLARHGVLIGGVALCSVMMVSELAMFPRVNRLVELLHTYPYAIEEMQAEIIAASTATGPSNPVQHPLPVVVVLQPDVLETEFNADLREVYGEGWMNTDFYVLHQQFKITPLWHDYLVGELLHAYFPDRDFSVEIR